jgi:plastocyanin
MFQGRKIWSRLSAGLMMAMTLSPAGTLAEARAETPAEQRAAKGGAAGPTMAQFNRLQNEVRDQRQLIVEMLQSEQQRYEMLLKLIRFQGAAGAPEAGQVPSLPALPASIAGAAPAATNVGRSRGEPAAAEHTRRSATVTGRVGLNAGADTSDVYVFIENVKGASARGKTLEIKQEGKQFSPRLAVVQSGTSVVFPNLDTVYHNVFSNSPRNSFDLGTSRAGETPRPVTLTGSGVVEIFCNMHQKMSASVLVVPNPLYAKVRSDGSFRIENVPVGARKVVAWSPHAKSAEQQIDVTSSGAQVTFALEADERKAHLNKLGQAYGTYRE